MLLIIQILHLILSALLSFYKNFSLTNRADFDMEKTL